MFCVAIFIICLKNVSLPRHAVNKEWLYLLKFQLELSSCLARTWGGTGMCGRRCLGWSLVPETGCSQTHLVPVLLWRHSLLLWSKTARDLSHHSLSCTILPESTSKIQEQTWDDEINKLMQRKHLKENWYHTTNDIYGNLAIQNFLGRTNTVSMRFVPLNYHT